MADTENFMTWPEIAEIHEMGFEIGNHSWTHANFSVPRNAARLAGELDLVENALADVGVPKPESFAWCGNGFGPEALAKLRDLGYRFARRGMQPETPYGEITPGPAFDPARHDPLLILTTGDAYPDWTFEHFQQVLAQAAPGEIVVLQFHGVPDTAHPWVHTPPEMFERYMEHLKTAGFETLALRDIEPYVAGSAAPDDPTAGLRYPETEAGSTLPLPVEVEATRADLDRWMETMFLHHAFSNAEATKVSGLPESEVESHAQRYAAAAPEPADRPRIEPYPGGRHPRIGFLDGAIDPMRGTKASVFLPWNPAHYVVVDLPEAIFSNLGLLFLAHTDVPTIWNEHNVVLENVDWERTEGGGLRHQWTLPNQVQFGALMRPVEGRVDMELWLRNGTQSALNGLRTQICVMLKGAPRFNEQTLDNKLFREPVAAVGDEQRRQWILTAWEGTGRSWGNRGCPCFHADPVLPDCAPGETVRVKGRLWFYEGPDVGAEIERAARRFGRG